MNRLTAQNIIASLSSGTVSLSYAHYYDVGRKEQLKNVINEIENKSSKLRFINGDYGVGKTHFMASIRNWAIKNNYVPSHVVLSPRGTPLYDLAAVYSRIMKNLAIDNEDSESPIESVMNFLFQIFREWLDKYISENRPRCEKFCMDPLYCHHCNKNGAIERLYIENFNKLDLRLQIAIILYRSAKWGFNPDFSTADLVIRWLEGEPLYRRDLNYLGLWDDVIKDDILKGLKEISKLISLVGKKGLVIMLDEAEGVESLTPHQKPIAYENLQFLINGARKSDEIYFLYATTPTFYNDVDSYSYELSMTVNGTACTELPPLTPSETILLGSNVAKIYLISLGLVNDNEKWEASKQITESYCNKYIAKANTSVRDMITGLIEKLKSIDFIQ